MPMLTLARICEALLPLAYAGAVGFYALAFFRREEVFQRWTRPLLVAALVIHSVLIYARTMYHGHCLVYTPFEMMTLISFTISLTYLVVELASRERSTGVFFVGLALLFQTVSAMFSASPQDYSANPVLLNNTVGLHISAALFGYTAFTVSAVYGTLYLMLFSKIRSNKFGTFYERLPSLQLLEKMSEKSAVVGLVFLSIAIVIAFVYLPDVLPTFSYADPKIVTTGIVWGIYMTALLARHIAKLEARKAMVLSLVGFIGTIISMTVVNLLVSGFHRF